MLTAPRECKASDGGSVGHGSGSLSEVWRGTAECLQRPVPLLSWGSSREGDPSTLDLRFSDS